METEYKVTDFVGKIVITNEGQLIGKVKELVINVDTWAVTNMQVEIEKAKAKELGLKTKLFGNLLALVETKRIISVGDQVVIDVPYDKFAEYSKSVSADE